MGGSHWAKVARITGGDPLTLLAESRQTMIWSEGIDAPEKGQPFGDKGRQELGRLVFGKTVKIETKGKDRYGRTLGRVYVGETDVNVHLVHQGFAWWYRKYSDDPKFKTAADAARRDRRGLWADPSRVAPWDWRDQQREAVAKTPAGTTAEVAGYWLNTSTGVRHNNRCEQYGKTKRGRPCGPDEGKACGICGG